jgi:hypothetical protein
MVKIFDLTENRIPVASISKLALDWTRNSDSSLHYLSAKGHTYTLVHNMNRSVACDSGHKNMDESLQSAVFDEHVIV